MFLVQRTGTAVAAKRNRNRHSDQRRGWNKGCGLDSMAKKKGHGVGKRCAPSTRNGNILPPVHKDFGKRGCYNLFVLRGGSPFPFFGGALWKGHSKLFSPGLEEKNDSSVGKEVIRRYLFVYQCVDLRVLRRPGHRGVHCPLYEERPYRRGRHCGRHHRRVRLH